MQILYFYLLESMQHYPMSSGMEPRKRQEFHGLDSIPFSEAGTCRKNTRGVWEVAGESLVKDAEEKKGLQAEAPF